MLSPDPLLISNTTANDYMYQQAEPPAQEKHNFDLDIANAYTKQQSQYGSCSIFEMNTATTSTTIKDDTHLAVLIASLFGYTHPIATYKSINWLANGNNTLTPKDITDLKDKYDLDNLSKQDYYNLLSDLSNINVISAEDIQNQVTTPAPNDTYLIPAEYAIEKFVDPFEEQNLVKMINHSFKVFYQKFEFICSKDFLHLNPNTNYHDYKNFINKAKSKIRTYEKLKLVYETLTNN